MVRARRAYGRRWDRSVERDEPSAVVRREAEQVGVGNLSRTVNSRMIGARRPSAPYFAVQPRPRLPVVQVPCVQQRQEHVDVQQRAHVR